MLFIIKINLIYYLNIGEIYRLKNNKNSSLE